MTKTIISKTLPKRILDITIREVVASAMKEEHADIGAAIKSMAAVTGINANAIAKWHTGQHTPSTAHFLTLAAYYPSALRILLTLIERDDLWQIAVRENIPNDMHKRLSALHSQYKKRGDISHENSAKNSAFSLNKRQLWFLEMIQKTERMQNKHIASRWNVTLRTAKRDTEALIAEGFIVSVRSGGTGWFEWTGESYDRR
jgi:transcriptional regulator with XRE-family HTH domain